MSLYGSSIRPATGPHILAAPPGPAPAPASKKRKDRERDREEYHPEPGANSLFRHSVPAVCQTGNLNPLEPDARTVKPIHSISTFSSSLLDLARPPHVRKPQPQPLLAHPTQAVGKQPNSTPAPAPVPVKPGGNRLLMAGYMAHEFLSHGTLFGRPYGTTTVQAAATSTEELRQKQKLQYEGVASIMWGSGGVHVPGVVNPTQLGTWLQKQQLK